MAGPLPSSKLYNDHWLHAYSISNTKAWRQHTVSYDPRDWDQWEKVAIYRRVVTNPKTYSSQLWWKRILNFKLTSWLFMTASKDILASLTGNEEAVRRNGKWLWNQLWIVYEYSDVGELSYIPRYSTLTMGHHVQVWIQSIRSGSGWSEVECALLIANQLKLSKLST